MNFLNAHLLTTIIFLPAIGALVVSLLPSGWKTEARVTSLGFSLAVLILSLLAFLLVDPSGEFDFKESAAWIPLLGIRYSIGIDGVSALMNLLVSFLLSISILISWKQIEKKVRGFYAAILFSAAGMFGAFSSLDIFLFYVFWMIVVISTCFLIGVWGGDDRVRASVKFLLFMTFAGACMLSAIICAADMVGSFDLLSWYAHRFAVIEQLWLFAAFAAAFSIMVPMVLFHTWLVDLCAKAPTAVSILIFGVFIKIGAYGFFRIAMPTFPLAAAHFAEPLLVLCVAGIVGGSLIMLVQSDIKRFIAYSSVPYMALIVLGLVAFDGDAATGAVLQMANHGITVAALLALAGMLQDRRQSTAMDDFGGMARAVPALAVFFMMISFSYIGLPGLNNFAGSFLILLGGFQTRTVFAGIALLGYVLVAAGVLWMIRRIFFGRCGLSEDRAPCDLRFREYLVLVPIIAIVVIVGIWPQALIFKVAKPARVFVELSKRVEMIIPAGSAKQGAD